MNRQGHNDFLKSRLNIEHPIILAPMFLISNEKMVIAALKAGITGAIPALNYRSPEALRMGIRNIKKEHSGAFGINLIVNKSNFKLKEQLSICCEEKVAFIITSLGSPAQVIQEAHKNGILVFCDVTSAKYALKVEKLGADALIAVSSEAGGHAGNQSFRQLIPDLINQCTIPIISAGGIGNHQSYIDRLAMGVCGVSVGSIFIACEESPVNEEYKQACIQYGAKDIVLTSKLSGTPCTVINTPYVQQTGTGESWLEYILNRNRRLKKWFKAFVFLRGMKRLQKSAFGSSYKTLWCAGPSIEFVHGINSIELIVSQLTKTES